MKEQSSQTKTKKPIYEKSWFWVLAIIGGIVGFSFIGNVIGGIADPEVVIPDVKGLTKVEACQKIEGAGFICKTGSYYDSSATNQKVSGFYIYNKDGQMDFNAGSSMRAKKSSTIKLDFEQTEEQKAKEAESRAKIEAENKEYEEKKKAEESAKQNSSSSTSSNSSTSTNVSWREFITEYEAFANKYIDIMKKYKANPSDISILSDYTEMMTKYNEFAQKADKVKSQDVSTAELVEYTNAINRISQKMLEVQ